MSFKELPLHPKILQALEKAGYETPTEIQLKAISKIIKGFDIRASAQTGTGKTAAFLLPILTRLTAKSERPGRGPRALILVPTRELAMQVAGQAEKYGKDLHWIKTVCVVGGVPYVGQIRNLSKPCDLLIATPGRLIDLVNQGKVSFSRIEVVVLDEADRMLDMGFAEAVQGIVEATPTSRQTLLFSATLEGSVLELSKRFMNKPMEIVVQAEHKSHANIEQELYFVDNLHHKNRLLEHILAGEGVGNTIIFTATKRHSDQLAEELRESGSRAIALHGDMSQNQRTRALTKLRTGHVDILVATDVAARGIDVQSITHVINFDLPQNVEDYVHRIGRTGRAGALGKALTFVSKREASFVKRIEKFTGKKIPVVQIEGFEAKMKADAEPNRPERRFHGKKQFHVGGPSNAYPGKRPNGPRRFQKRRQKQRG